MNRTPAAPWALIAAITLLTVGLGELGVGLTMLDLHLYALGDLLLSLVGWGTFVELLSSLGMTVTFHSVVDNFRTTHVPGAFTGGLPHLGVGLSMWVVGWALIAFAVRSEPPGLHTGPTALKLHPRLAEYVDFHWGTLAAYGFGVFLSELSFVGVYLVLVGKGSAQGVATGGLSPVWAFVWAFAVAMLVAFAGGFVGSANSKRLSTPEATIALVYFGLPVPLLLSAMHFNSWLMLNVGYRLREVVYLSSLLGESRPELGYWLITAALGLGLFLGINLGFVLTSSGRLDLRASYELFVSSRHVSVFIGTGDRRLAFAFAGFLVLAGVSALLPLGVWAYVLSLTFLVAAVTTSYFHWRMLVGVFGVLMTGIVPPLIYWAIVQAAEAVVERTRIRRLGQQDPLAAAEAVNTVKLRAQTPTAMMTALSVGGVGVGVMALIIVLSVMSGFEADLQKKILGTNSHGVVLKYSPDMPEFDDVMTKVKSVRGIAGATPFILNEVMISSEGNISGSMIKGIDPATVGSVTDLPEYLLPGGELKWLETPEKIAAKKISSLDPLFDDRPATGDEHARDPKDPEPARADPPPVHDPLIEIEQKGDGSAGVLPGIIVGRELAASLKVVVGDRVNVVSPLGGELGPQGPMPKSRPFKVAGIFYSGMYEYDSKFVYILLSEAQTFFNVKGATGIEVKVTDVDNARGTMKSVYDLLEGYPYRTKDWGEMNRNLFAALRLEKLVMGIILSIIVIVAAGLIVATVIMLVLEKRKEISVLKALGVPDGGIVKIFLFEGLQIGVAGSVLGLIAGLAWCVFIEKVGIKLDPQVYYIPALPVRIEPFQTALSVVIAILVTFLASIYPALKASQVEPVDGLKSE